jgi:pimeloyl-ACP methyl ester carboxylesterase
MGLKEEYITVAEKRIRYIEKGEGPPLILLHGMGGSLEWWEYNLDALSQKCRVIAFDFPGFGYSSLPDFRFRLDSVPDFMASLMNAFQLTSSSLIGNSMGGLFALVTAAKIPERIERLILVNNAGFGPKLSFLLRLGTVFPVGELALSIRNRYTARFFLSRLFNDPKKIPYHLIPKVLEIFDPLPRRKFCLRLLRSGINIKGLREKIWVQVLESAASLPHKTLIVWGAGDRVIPVDQAQAGKELIKNCRLHVFEKCGHLPQVEWAEEFNSLVLEFLES